MSKGVMPFEELVKKLNLNSGFFETSTYILEDQMRVIAGNFDGAGMSHGNMQYNYAYGNPLNDLYSYMFANHRDVIVTAFGSYTAELAEFENATKTFTQTELINWGDSLTDFSDGEGRKIIEPWNTLFGNVLVTPECMEYYIEIEQRDYLPDALDLFKQMPVISRASLASFLDLKINRGRYYPINTLLGDFDLIEADTTLTDFEKEAKKIEAINLRGNDRTNAIDSDWWLERRTCMANQGGDYFGALYDPETQFDINQEPAIKEKLDSMAINSGASGVTKLYMGANLLKSVYSGAKLIGNRATPYTTAKAPVTQFRTNPSSYVGLDKTLTSITLDSGQPLWVDVQNWVASRTYYTIDGTTPTTSSPLYHESFNFTEPVTLKTLTVSLSGVAEAVRTINVEIRATNNNYRYVRFIGYGDNTATTTRLVELKALEGTTNRMSGLLPISGEAPNGGSVDAITNDIISHEPGSYPYWWTGEGVPTLVYDLGAGYPIDSLLVVMYSPSADPRTTQFIVEVSPDNATWTTVADYTANADFQPESGYTLPI